MILLPLSTSFCLIVLPLTLQDHLNPAKKHFSFSHHDTQMLFPYILDAAVSLHPGLCCFTPDVGIVDNHFTACWKTVEATVSPDTRLQMKNYY